MIDWMEVLVDSSKCKMYWCIESLIHWDSVLLVKKEMSLIWDSNWGFKVVVNLLLFDWLGRDLVSVLGVWFGVSVLVFELLIIICFKNLG